MDERRLAGGVWNRIGTVRRLVTVALLAVGGSVAAIQGLGICAFEQREMARTQALLNLGLLKELLGPIGTEWTLRDGRLGLGGPALDGRNDIVDAVKREADGAATAFQGGECIATHMQRPDGNSGVGARPAPGAAFDAAITRSPAFRDGIRTGAWHSANAPPRATSRSTGVIPPATAIADLISHRATTRGAA